MPDGVKTVLIAPGFSQADITTGMAQVLSFIPAGRVASLGRNLAQRVGLSATGAGATEAGLQATSQALGSEQEIDKGQIALAAGLGGAAEVVAPAIQAVRQARINRAAKKQQKSAQETEELIADPVKAAEELGVRLFPAQLTEDASQLERQSFVASLPSGAKKANKELRLQNEEVANAMDNVLSSIAPPAALSRGEKGIRSAAQEAIEAKKLIREERASPLYTEAKKENSDVNIEPIIGLINNKLGNLPAGSKSARELEKVRKLINQSTVTRKTTQTGIITPKIEKIPKLRKLHQTKLEIDDLINKFGDNSLGRTAKSHVKDVQVSLLNQMDEASDFYRSARETFAELSPAVNEIEDSIIGKIAGLDDTQLKTASGKLFDPAETNPETVRLAKKEITDIDPDKWNDIIRVELEKRMGKIKSDIEGAASAENLPAQLFNSVFGNTKQRRVLFSAVDSNSESGKNLKYLEDVLKRAAQGRPGGSQTAVRKVIDRELKEGALNSFREWMSPLKKALLVGEEKFFNDRVKSMADAMFDPEWRPQMKEIRALDPKGNSAQRAMLQLLNDVESQEDSEK
jgi:hypothetical protein